MCALPPFSQSYQIILKNQLPIGQSYSIVVHPTPMSYSQSYHQSIDPDDVRHRCFLYQGVTDEDFVNGYNYLYSDIFGNVKLTPTGLLDLKRRYDGIFNRTFGKKPEIFIKDKWYKESDFIFELLYSNNELKPQQRDQKLNSILL